MLKNKSYFKKSTGDEAGCAPKKGVITSKNTGKVYFTMWSMDVKVEGENVVRQSGHDDAQPWVVPGNSRPWPYTDALAQAPERRRQSGDEAARRTTCKCKSSANCADHAASRTCCDTPERKCMLRAQEHACEKGVLSETDTAPVVPKQTAGNDLVRGDAPLTFGSLTAASRPEGAGSVRYADSSTAPCICARRQRPQRRASKPLPGSHARTHGAWPSRSRRPPAAAPAVSEGYLDRCATPTIARPKFSRRVVHPELLGGVHSTAQQLEKGIVLDMGQTTLRRHSVLAADFCRSHGRAGIAARCTVTERGEVASSAPDCGICHDQDGILLDARRQIAFANAAVTSTRTVRTFRSLYCDGGQVVAYEMPSDRIATLATAGSDDDVGTARPAAHAGRSRWDHQAIVGGSHARCSRVRVHGWNLDRDGHSWRKLPSTNLHAQAASDVATLSRCAAVDARFAARAAARLVIPAGRTRLRLRAVRLRDNVLAGDIGGVSKGDASTRAASAAKCSGAMFATRGSDWSRSPT